MKHAALIAAALIAAAPAAADAQVRLPGVGAQLELIVQRRGDREDRDERRGGRDDFERRGQTISMSQAINIARSRVPGRVLDAGMAGPNYRVRLISADGRVVDFIIDAGSGAILQGG